MAVEMAECVSKYTVTYNC